MTMPDHALPDHVVPNSIAPDYVVPDYALRDDAPTDDGLTDDALTDDALPRIAAAPPGTVVSPARTFVRMLKRRSGIAVPDFQHAWLGVDLGAVASLPGFVRYSQHHALLRGYAKGELVFDGFEDYVFDDADSCAAARRSEAWGAVQRATSGITDPERGFSALVRVSVQKHGIVPAGAIHSAEFVIRRPDMTPDAFAEYWITRHGPLARDLPQMVRYEQNHLGDRDERDAPPRFDGWASTWFHSTAAMRAAAREPLYAAVRADEPNFLVPPLPVLLTTERLALCRAC